MKRILACFLALALILSVGVASASIKVKGLSEKNLYELYSEIRSQMQLNQLHKKASYQVIKDFNDFERNPNKHKNEWIYFEGKIIQAVEGSPESTYRLAFKGDSEKIFLVTFAVPEDAERLLEDDNVCVYGKFMGTETYSSVIGKSITIPYCSAMLMVHPVNNNNVKIATNEELEAALAEIREQLQKTAAKDKGHVKLTEKNYDDYARNEKLHTDEKISFSGKVLQVIEDDAVTTMRVSLDKWSDKVVYLAVPNELLTVRVLEDDTINVKGAYTGLYSYSSTLGGKITIPSCRAETIEIKGYKAPGKFTHDKEGNIKLNKKLFEDFSRRPKEHMNDPIAFTAKVVQVIEGSDSSEYRMAVDDDYDAMIYVQLPNTSRTMRILEDDKVSVIATYGGLLTYQSTLGAPITIPRCTASSVTVPGKKAETAGKDASGKYNVTKNSYEFFARDGDSYKSEPLAFTAEVIQVVEDSSTTTYRLAVDKDSNCMFLATIDNDKLSIRILEDDIVSVEATCTGLYTYSSALGGMITVPSCLITSYNVQSYTPKGLGSTDSNGNYKITKSNYQEIARNPDAYKDQNITFRGKVVQAMERSNGENSYRVAVDSDNDCIFYVEFTVDTNASRILEGDTVTLTGKYYGIYSYTTTLGSTMSVPAIIADSMK